MCAKWAQYLKLTPDDAARHGVCSTLADLEVVERQWMSTIVLLVWVKLMNPLQAVFQDFFVLVKMIALMIGAVQRRTASCPYYGVDGSDTLQGFPLHLEKQLNHANLDV